MWFTDRRPSSTNLACNSYGILAHRAMTSARFGIALLTLLAWPSAPARAADPAPAESAATPTLTAVAPVEFAAGATVTIAGTGLAEGDTVKLDGKPLTDLKITATSVTGTVPTAAKAGKKLTLHRGKKKVGELTAFTFVPAPKLTAAAPKFAAPGETVTLKGKALDKVTALSVGGAAVPIAEQTATTLKFTAPEGLQTGAVLVKSLGGEAGLKHDYEIFYAPTLASVDPPAGFEGDAIAVKGAHLAGKVKIKLGAKTLKASEQGDAEVKLTVAKGSKSGPISASARGKTATMATDFTVFPTPLLTSVPKEVGAPGELKVSGKHLDAVTTWRLGQVTLTPAEGASAGKVVLAIPAEAPTDQPLVAVSQGREFASKKPVATVKTPIVYGLAFWTSADGKGVEGVIRGADFSDKTKFTLAGKPLKTGFVGADQVTFALPKAPAAKEQPLAAKAGKYSGAPVTVDGAAGGYRVAADKLGALLPTGLTGYDLVAAQLDLEASEHLRAEVEDIVKDSPAPERVAALGLRIGQDLQRVALAQAAVCSTMAVGKGKDQAGKNGAAGEVLRQSQRHAQALAEALRQLWATLGPDALATAGLPEADAAVASVASAEAKVQAACKGRFYGDGKIVTEASTPAKLDLERLYRPAILAAFEDVLAQGKNWSAVEKAVGDRLASFPAARRKSWQDVLKASKAGVEASAAGGVTGKGAKGDKHVDTQGKPKGNAGKGKGKAN